MTESKSKKGSVRIYIYPSTYIHSLCRFPQIRCHAHTHGMTAKQVPPKIPLTPHPRAHHNKNRLLLNNPLLHQHAHDDTAGAHQERSNNNERQAKKQKLTALLQKSS